MHITEGLIFLEFKYKNPSLNTHTHIFLEVIMKESQQKNRQD